MSACKNGRNIVCIITNTAFPLPKVFLINSVYDFLLIQNYKLFLRQSLASELFSFSTKNTKNDSSLFTNPENKFGLGVGLDLGQMYYLYKRVSNNFSLFLGVGCDIQGFCDLFLNSWLVFPARYYSGTVVKPKSTIYNCG